VSSYGFLHTSEHQAPRTVQLELCDDELVVTGSDWTERLPFRLLRKLKDDGAQIQVGRRGDRSWRLSASGTVAAELRTAIGGRTRWLKWGAARTWHGLAFVIVLVFVELVKIPPEWLAPVLPNAIQERLVDQDLRGYYGSYCTSPEGERAVRKLIGSLDSEIAHSVKIRVTNGGEFLITAVPGDRIAITYAFLQALEPDEFAALLAHEIAHLQRGDEVRAALRANGTLGALVGTLSGTRKPDYVLEFSEDEERSADARAIQMLRRAEISTLPGAELFARMEMERTANRSFGKEQYYLHWGFGSDRAAAWRDSQDQGERLQTRPALSEAEADALFNYCWHHRGPPRHPIPTKEIPRTDVVKRT
jgi:hypothetical protein